LLQGLEIDSTSYIVNEALSAGSYIALNTDDIYMKEQATMGASGVITGDGTAADKKAQSAWIAAMKSDAESNDRDRGYAEGIANNRVALLDKINLSDATIVETETSVAEDIARFVTNPVVIPILLSVASLGLIVELYSPGFGVAGTMGVAALILFFYGH